MKHTPGPYSFDGPFINTGKIGIHAPPKDSGWATCLAEISVANVGEETAISNASLFAAAPELLEALKRCHEAIWKARMNDPDQSDEKIKYWSKLFAGPLQSAKTVIAKAEGRE